MNRNLQNYVTLYLRLALGTGFLSAVADRFGLWGRPGAPLVAWGNFQNFLHYTAIINPWLPASWIPSVGWITTTCEAAFGIALNLGVRTRLAAFASGFLTLVFALAMVLALGVKAALNYSVFAFSAGSFLLATVGAYPWSLDSLLSSNMRRHAIRPQNCRDISRHSRKRLGRAPQKTQPDLPRHLSWFSSLILAYTPILNPSRKRDLSKGTAQRALHSMPRNV